MTELAIILPVPPSTNALFANKRSGGRVKTKAYAAWREEARWHIDRAWRDAGKPKFGAPLHLSMVAGIDRKRDLSNLIKAAEDALVTSIPDMPDDCWNDSVRIERAAVAHGRMHVTIRDST